MLVSVLVLCINNNNSFIDTNIADKPQQFTMLRYNKVTQSQLTTQFTFKKKINHQRDVTTNVKQGLRLC